MTPKRDVAAIYRTIASNASTPAMQLGWDSEAVQQLNFELAVGLALERGIDPRIHSVHDAGCGFGHLRDYLLTRCGSLHSYVGTDASPDSIRRAYELHHTPVSQQPFIERNLLQVPAPEVDATFALGLLSYHNHRSIKQLLNTLWRGTRRVLVFNAWWYMEGYEFAEEQPDLRRAVEKFLYFKTWDLLDGPDYGIPTERMFVVVR